MTISAEATVDPRVANETVTREVASWPGVTTHAGPIRGGVEFRYRHRALGHLHATFDGPANADLILPPHIGEARIAEGRGRPHGIIPALGWITAPMANPAEIANAI